MRGIHTRRFKHVWLILLLGLAGSVASYAATTTGFILTMTNTVWKFQPNTNAANAYTPADAWTAKDFNDSAWLSGKGLFGYESTPNEYAAFGQFGTFITPPGGVNGCLFPSISPCPLSQTTGPGGPSTYFRTHFNWSGPTAGVTLNFTNTGDDGWIFYLNGQELFAFDMPTTRPMTWDVNNLPNGANPLGEAVAIPAIVVPNNLVDGDNVIAVELHQQASSSSDDVIGISMTATLPEAPSNCAPTQPTNRTVRLNQVVTLLACGTGSPTPNFQWQLDGSDIPGATTATYVFTNTASLGLNGFHTFHCRVSNAVGSFTTRDASINFTDDTTPPHILRIVAVPDLTNIVVEYDEFVNTVEAPDPLNYIVSDSIGNAVGLVGGVLAPSGTSAMLAVNPDTALVGGQTYTLTVIGATIHDLANNAIDEVTMNFVAPSANECAVGTFEAYNGTTGDTTVGLITGNSVANLTGHKSFPDSPSFVSRLINLSSGLAQFDSRTVYPDDSHEAYGGRMRGLFIPPISGAWRLFLRSDDGSELWFNPNGPGAGGRTKIAAENGCCNAFLEPGATQTSEPMNLVAGQAYYLEALYKEGTGGDYCQVAVRMEGDVTPAAQLVPIPSTYLGSASLAGVAGGFTITQQPANAQALAGGSASFTVGTSTDVPLCYQWLLNGSEIPGAVGRTLTLSGLAEGDSVVSVRVSIVGGASQTSANANLHVGVDTIPPVAVSATADASGGLLVSFRPVIDEDLDPVSSQVASNYRIDGVAPVSAIHTNLTNVLLVAAAPFAPCVDHTVVITGVKDVSQNNLNPNPTTLHFTAPIVLVANSASQIWRYLGGVDLGTTWSAKDFNDATWDSGPGVLAWEPDNNTPATWPIRTVITGFTNFTDKPTYYFRTHFNLPTHPSTITALLLTEVVDDGAVAYINGVEVNLNRMTAPFNFATLAGGSTEPHPIEGPFSLPLTSNGLVPGDNVLAVEVHQSATTSSDIVWGAELVAQVSACGVGLTLTPVSPTQARVEWTDGSYHLESAPAITGPWTAPGTASGSLITTTTGNRFLRLKQ